jgi:hypothetical protein
MKLEIKALAIAAAVEEVGAEADVHPSPCGSEREAPDAFLHMHDRR